MNASARRQASVLWLGAQAESTAGGGVRGPSEAWWLGDSDACGEPRTGFAAPGREDWSSPSAMFAPLELTGRFVRDLRAWRPAQVRLVALSAVGLDLARLAIAFGFDTSIRLPDDFEPAGLDTVARRWLGGVLLAADAVVCPQPQTPLASWLAELSVPHIADWPTVRADERKTAMDQWGYQTYAIGRRDHALLADMQRGLVAHFEGCGNVLDLGCGTGVFLDLLLRAGVPAEGVERNVESVRYARALGLQVVEDDALAFLEKRPGQYDGLYCSHFVEHLPLEGVERLLRACAAGLQNEGVVVFVFPDPESIRSQLLGFWRDPEHVRFYHPELVALMAEPLGLTLEYSSARAEGRSVVPFSMHPEPPPPVMPPSRWERLLRAFGFASCRELDAVRSRSDWMESQVRRLWMVNQTWAWNDNAVLRLRKQ